MNLWPYVSQFDIHTMPVALAVSTPAKDFAEANDPATDKILQGILVIVIYNDNRPDSDAGT